MSHSSLSSSAFFYTHDLVLKLPKVSRFGADYLSTVVFALTRSSYRNENELLKKLFVMRNGFFHSESLSVAHFFILCGVSVRSVKPEEKSFPFLIGKTKRREKKFFKKFPIHSFSFHFFFHSDDFFLSLSEHFLQLSL